MAIKTKTDGLSGLTTAEANRIRNKIGENKIKTNQRSKIKKIASWIISPISLMLLSASGMSYFIGKIFDFYFILVLYLINFLVAQWQEYKADKAVSELQSHFTIRILTLRDGNWQKLESTQLVPDDVIALHNGDVLPADCIILSANQILLDESTITGESEAVSKKIRDTAYSGTIVVSGELTARITATANNTRFAKTLTLAKRVEKRSALEKDILGVSKFLAFISIGCVVVLSVGLYLSKTDLSLILTTDLSLLIAGIPVAMPTVISLIMSLGLTALASKKVIVRRLASLEDLANINLLLTDKTGTVTHHHVAVSDIAPFNKLAKKDVLAFASTTTSKQDTNPLSLAIQEAALQQNTALPQGKIITLGDSTTKRTTAVAKIKGQNTAIAVGAVPVILNFCKLSPSQKKNAVQKLESAARSGLRTLAVAYNSKDLKERNMTLAGLIFLADKIREDAKPTVAYLKSQGIDVKMITGDHTAISQHVAEQIGLKGAVKNQAMIASSINSKTEFSKIAGFAEVFPEDKLKIVTASKQWYKVAVTGDGVNDIPAVSSADVGVAVKNAVDALRGTADIVLLTDGVAVIKDAIIEARKIFTRVFFYSVYRISESFRVIISITVLGLLYQSYPLSPIHLLLLALLNDIPIVSLAYDKVKTLNRPSAINVKQRLALSILFGAIGLINSLIFFLLLRHWNFPSEIIQTAFFLKLTVSGHLLIYVSHTENRWWKFLPEKRVILATVLTQAIATAIALTGIFVAQISWQLVTMVWIWSILWMQAAELVKWLRKKLSKSQLY